MLSLYYLAEWFWRCLTNVKSYMSFDDFIKKRSEDGILSIYGILHTK